MHEEAYSLHFGVRDYECDMQGIVNNAVYQNYFEHTRHEYIKTLGLDFAALTQAGIHVVVARAELDYLRPLKSGDQFQVQLRPFRLGKVRVVFDMGIYQERELHVRGRFFCAAMQENGRPCRDLSALAPLLEQCQPWPANN
ncbi:acyl-CoA thioesterase [Balneatrix alpica]|uniref:acyl-CoA thioesterase n=1 Tax=Balneatrix alpica TaxID=75684 RepID=UPI002738868B|nr:acyl-CoA thioesterase [Balneatrix alpica]